MGCPDPPPNIYVGRLSALKQSTPVSSQVERNLHANTPTPTHATQMRTEAPRHMRHNSKPECVACARAHVHAHRPGSPETAPTPPWLAGADRFALTRSNRVASSWGDIASLDTITQGERELRKEMGGWGFLSGRWV